jgi:transcriptional regulator with XRE-family HTH domain
MPSSDNTDFVFGRTRRACDPVWMRNRIKELRIAKGWSQEDLAERAGTTQQHIQRIEAGRQRLNTDHMEKFADIFQIHPFGVLVISAKHVIADEEAQLIEWYRALSEKDQAIIKAMLHPVETVNAGSGTRDGENRRRGRKSRRMADPQP